MTTPFSQACENNKTPILNVLNRAFAKQKQVLEIGSGTGQHAVYLAKNLPFLQWQTSDLLVNHQGIKQWINTHPSPNLSAPLTLDLSADLTSLTSLPQSIDAIFTANTLHIISWPLVQSFFNLVANKLAADGVLCIYGPFNYQGEYTSASNAHFDLSLRSRDEHSGIRNFEDICVLANQAGLSLQEDIAMPANNRILLFKYENSEQA